MTEKLKTLLDRAADAAFAMPDLDAILHDGDRAVRRRRVGAGLAAAAVLAVVAGGAAVVGDELGDRSESQVASQPDSDGMSWALGSVLHTPNGSIETGHPVRAYVRTAAGFVTVDDDGRVRSVVGGRTAGVGAMEPSSLYLVGDTEDSLAAWLEPTGSSAYQWVVVDQATGERVAAVPAGSGPDITGVVVALDDRRLYVKADRYRVIDVDSGASSVLDAPSRGSQLLAAEDGVLVWTWDDGEQSAYVVERPGAEPVRIPDIHGHQAVLSPDARWVTFDSDEARVYDATTGEQVALDVDTRVFATGYEWLDEDSLAMIVGRTETGPAELMVCQVPEGTCGTVAPDLGSFEELVESFALPVGTPVDE